MRQEREMRLAIEVVRESGQYIGDVLASLGEFL